MSDDLEARLAAAVAAQDEAALAECFVPDVEFRALIPPGDSSGLHLLDSHRDHVGDRLHVSYRFAGVEEGKAYVVEQHLFCTVGDGKIMRADLLCSGFRPPTSTSVPSKTSRA